MVLLKDLAAYLDQELEIAKVVGDFSNGLLVKGVENVQKVGIATNATFEVINRASSRQVQFLLTHHGGWSEIDLHHADEKKRMLSESGISLYVAHASLDNSERIGTSKVLAELLGLSVQGHFADYCAGRSGSYGDVAKQSFDKFVRRISRVPGSELTCFRNSRGPVRRVAIVTGGGYMTKWIEEAALLGCDTYVTGEGSMFAPIYCRERKINLVYAGHTATERPAVINLGKELGKAFPRTRIVAIPETFF